MNNTSNATATPNDDDPRAIPFSFLVLISTSEPTWRKVLSGTITLVALLQVLGNALMALAIGLDKKIRNQKEFIYMLYIALGDSLEGVFLFLAFFCGTGRQMKWRCMLDPRHIAFAYGGQFSKAIMVVVSVDRIIAMGIPIWYWKKGAALAHVLSNTALAYAVTAGTTAYMIELFSDLRRPISHCWTKCTFESTLDWLNLSRNVMSSLSVIAYLVVIILYIQFAFGRHISDPAQPNSRRQKEEDQRQKREARRVTVTLGLTVGLAFCLTVIPLGVIRSFLKEVPADRLTHYNYPILSLTSCYSIVNIVVFMARHAEIVGALRKIAHRLGAQNNLVAAYPLRQ